MKKNDFNAIVESLQSNQMNFTERTIPFRFGTIKLFFIMQLIDRASLAENIIKPLMLHSSLLDEPVRAQLIINSIIYADDCKIGSDLAKIEELVLSGMVVMLFSTDKQYAVINIKKVEKRSVPTPQVSYTLRGPQDCFTENLDSNLSLVRYRVKDKNLRIQNFDVGVRSKSRVAVLYLQDVANDTVVGEVQKRIESIDVDGIGESGELQNFLLNKKMKLFPQMGIVERSDMAAHSLYEGKVLVLVEGSGLALLAPKTFSEFFYSCDDRYDNKYFGLFMRILRYLAMIIAVTASSLFIAVTSFHTDILPTNYAILLSEMRVNVPFNALLGALFLEFLSELIREALLRVPKQIGPAIGIVGAIVIGQAAIAAGIVSPLLLILVATSLLASFAIPDNTLINPFRIIKLILILFTGFMGFYGFTIFLTFVLFELVSINSFGVPYMAPFAPFNLYDFKRTLINDTTENPKRPEYLRNKDKIRMK